MNLCPIPFVLTIGSFRFYGSEHFLQFFYFLGYEISSLARMQVGVAEDVFLFTSITIDTSSTFDYQSMVGGYITWFCDITQLVHIHWTPKHL